MKDTISSAVSLLQLHPISLTVDTGDLFIYADPLLEKVFYNLVENSIRHGENLTRISFSVETVDDTARIVYTDDGCGVPEEFKEAIFIRKHFKHTGFGLYLSREILEITGISIRETGTPGKGVQFEIMVPTEYCRDGDAET